MRGDPVRRAVIARTTGPAHADSCPDTAVAAERWGHTARNQRYWAEGGPPAVRQFFEYMRNLDEPYQMASEVMAYAKWLTVEKLPTWALIERFRELVALDKTQEAEDTVLDLNPLATWEEVHRSHRVDGAIDLEIAGVVSELMRRGVPRLEALHG